MAQPNEVEGSWRGSIVTAGDLEKIRSMGFIGSVMATETRLAPEGEVVPNPRGGEWVVFADHIHRGMGFAVSPFFRELLDFFGLQPHHLGANAVAQLCYFMATCEVYLGTKPSIGLFVRWCHFRSRYKEGAGGPMVDCGSAAIYSRSTNGLPKLPLPDTVRDWQTSYFYLRNLTAEDKINLPLHADASDEDELGVEGLQGPRRGGRPPIEGLGGVGAQLPGTRWPFGWRAASCPCRHGCTSCAT